MDDARRLSEIFFLYSNEKVERARANHQRFVYYTTGDTALKIIRNRELWMRSAGVMNDFSEVRFGLNCLYATLDLNGKTHLDAALDRSHKGLATDVLKAFRSFEPALLEATYLCSFSEHDPMKTLEEDKFGRLSMWRAYGGSAGVAIVIRGKALLSETNVMKVYSSPVVYGLNEFAEQFHHLCDRITANADFLKCVPREELRSLLINVFKFAVLSTKHKAFSEELEWRAIYLPEFEQSGILDLDLQSIRGIPQVIYKIPLKDIPEKSYTGANLNDLIDRIIVGPCQHPTEVTHAMRQALLEAKVDNAAARVHTSYVPLRVMS